MNQAIKIFVLLSVITYTAAQQCLCGIENVSKRIIGGTVVTENRYPWMVVMVIKNSTGSYSRCGGAIINDRWILTAAHCLEAAVEVNFAVGTNKKPEYIDYFDQAESFVSHGGYGRRPTNNDIALIKTAKEIQFSKTVRPICLPKKGDVAKGQFTVAGWGRTEKGTASDILLEVNVDEYAFADCNKDWNRQLNQTTQVCAANLKRDSCNGDSGGPLMQRSGGKIYAAGIVSFGSAVKDCGEAREAVYNRVEPYLDWIAKYTFGAKTCP